jgi:5-methylcytosine-specific restriction protein B
MKRFPDNLFVIGTVNVDETTYMFSPKVLDRANTIEFRVAASDLAAVGRKPTPIEPGPDELSAGFLDIARDDNWHLDHPAPGLAELQTHLVILHNLLAGGGFEFGHRVYYEAVRFAAMLNAAGNAEWLDALDFQVLQKILPRLHGSRRHLEPTLVALKRFCVGLEYDDGATPDSDPAAVDVPLLPRSYVRLDKLLRGVRVNQFASFAE